MTAFVIKPLIALLIAAAAVVFLWGIFEFIAGQDDEKKRAQGKQHILWGIVGLFVMVGAYGILEILARTFGISIQPTPGLLPLR